MVLNPTLGGPRGSTCCEDAAVSTSFFFFFPQSMWKYCVFKKTNRWEPRTTWGWLSTRKACRLWTEKYCGDGLSQQGLMEQRDTLPGGRVQGRGCCSGVLSSSLLRQCPLAFVTMSFRPSLVPPAVSFFPPFFFASETAWQNLMGIRKWYVAHLTLVATFLWGLPLFLHLLPALLFWLAF